MNKTDRQTSDSGNETRRIKYVWKLSLKLKLVCDTNR